MISIDVAAGHINDLHSIIARGIKAWQQTLPAEQIRLTIAPPRTGEN